MYIPCTSLLLLLLQVKRMSRVKTTGGYSATISWTIGYQHFFICWRMWEWLFATLLCEYCSQQPQLQLTNRLIFSNSTIEIEQSIHKYFYELSHKCTISVVLDLSYIDAVAVTVFGGTEVLCCYLPSRHVRLLLTEPVSDGCLPLSLSSPSPLLLVHLVLIFSFMCWSQ